MCEWHYLHKSVFRVSLAHALRKADKSSRQTARDGVGREALEPVPEFDGALRQDLQQRDRQPRATRRDVLNFQYRPAHQLGVLQRGRPFISQM